MISEFQGQYRFLSNFHCSPIEFEGRLWRSVEHAYQATKSLDDNVRDQICRMSKPGDAKRFGRTIVLRPDWEEVKLAVMLCLLELKFAIDPLRMALLQTGDEELIEGNYWGDRFWGVCAGTGQNHLGKLLMQVRAELHGTYPDDRSLNDGASDGNSIFDPPIS